MGDYNIQEGTYIQIHMKFSGGTKDNKDKNNNDNDDEEEKRGKGN